MSEQAKEDIIKEEQEYEKNHEKLTSFVAMNEDENLEVIAPHFTSVKVDNCVDEDDAVPLWMLQESSGKIMKLIENIPSDISTLKAELVSLIKDEKAELSDLGQFVKALADKSASKEEVESLKNLYAEIQEQVSKQEELTSKHTSEIDQLRKLIVDEAVVRETVDSQLRGVLEDKIKLLFEKAAQNELNDEKTRDEILATVKTNLDSTTTNLRETLKETIQRDIFDAVRAYDEKDREEELAERELRLVAEKELQNGLQKEIDARTAAVEALSADLAKEAALREAAQASAEAAAKELQVAVAAEEAARKESEAALQEELAAVAADVQKEAKTRAIVDLALASDIKAVEKDLASETEARVAADEDLLSRLTAERERLAGVQAQLAVTEGNMKNLSETLANQEAALKDLIQSYDARLGDDSAFQLNKYWRFVTKGAQHQVLSIQYRKSANDKWLASSPFFNVKV